ncbi:RTA1 like protein-domain-containing protein [Talaromyces proteolyticus]|uniref:RTA1 like protein-domain-containing protein n=1 Tax=Talaromyces proteolyticus TaxID=1131652 RepID=A0AAD4KMB0_9EURO|nr:RTA1 like protein-domain-containing protein [Talaromyces proteolyticus]KAH8692376.1 RTA1 like protein-domain-containing protein [Talaromyces proteolyticus]
MASSETSQWKAYNYNPSLAAAVVFIVLFLIVSIIHVFYLIRTRTLFFIPFIIGGLFETVGYIGRAMSAQQSPNWALGPYIMQSTLTLVAPALFAASIYMELGRIIRVVHGEQLALVRVTWMTKFFVAGDVLSFLMQATGAGVLASSHSSTNSTGTHIIVGGLFLQLIFFAFFLASAITFQRRIQKHPTPESVADYIPWTKHMMALHTSSVVILIRSIFRVIEYLQGQDGSLLSTETYLYIFDASLMFLVMVTFIYIHPSEINCLLGKGHRHVTRGGLALTEFKMGV